MLQKDYFPVITSVKHITPEVIEIKRAIIYKKFFNTQPYPTETIRIDRNKVNSRPQDIVLESYADYGFKKELTRLFGIGYLVKR